MVSHKGDKNHKVEKMKALTWVILGNIDIHMEEDGDTISDPA